MLLVRAAVLRVVIILWVDQRLEVLTTKVDVGLIRILRLVHLLARAMREILTDRLERNVQKLNTLTALRVVENVVDLEIECSLALWPHLLKCLLKKFEEFLRVCFG